MDVSNIVKFVLIIMNPSHKNITDVVVRPRRLRSDSEVITQA